MIYVVHINSSTLTTLDGTYLQKKYCFFELLISSCWEHHQSFMSLLPPMAVTCCADVLCLQWGKEDDNICRSIKSIKRQFFNLETLFEGQDFKCVDTLWKWNTWEWFNANHTCCNNRQNHGVIKQGVPQFSIDADGKVNRYVGKKWLKDVCHAC